jgi:hypothetical protein
MEEVRRRALTLLSQGSLTLDDLWIAFFSVGGDAGQVEPEAYIYGLMPISDTDVESLSDALLELLGN